MELSSVMAAVGLAQNFSALKALVTEGIQKGHMTLHARSVVKAAGTPTKLFDQVLEQLLINGEIKVWKAREILEDLQRQTSKNQQIRLPIKILPLNRLRELDLAKL